jgi:dipeptidase E
MSKILFLTSSPMTCRGGGFNEANAFVEKLKKSAINYRKALFITAFPDNYEDTDRFAEEIRQTAFVTGIEFDTYNVLDRRNENQADMLVKNSNFIILGGGHVPTQAEFFRKIKLKELLADFNGIIFGISAGSMNCATEVYAQPELDGEAEDEEYVRFFEGLGLTDYMIIPHYQDIKDTILDGKRLFEDITYPDSYNRKFYAICDGSYLYSEDGKTQIFGESYLISNGKIEKICKGE